MGGRFVKQITCEICGGKNIIKRDGAYVCADCGIKYTADEIKKLLSNAPDDAPACSELPLEDSDSTQNNPSVDRENPDKTNHKSKIPLVAVMACVCIALLVVVFKIVIPNVRYNNAVSLMNDGKYEDAIAAFEALDGYKDSTDKIDECNLGVLKKVKIGDSIEFGSYEQDNDTTNGKDSIEWYVLDKEDNRFLVISKYALVGMQYNRVNSNDSNSTSTSRYETWLANHPALQHTWESCTLRAWLNSTFLEEAFSESEQQQIQTTTVLAENNSQSDAELGNDTDDKMFLLSTAEFEKYCTTDELRTCAPTAYAISSSADTSETNKDLAKATCVWWLRTQGTSHTCSCVVDNGNINYSGENIAETSIYVRPAMWIDLNA